MDEENVDENNIIDKSNERKKSVKDVVLIKEGIEDKIGVMTNNSTSEYVFKYISGTEQEIQSFYNAYFPKIPNELKASFNIGEDISQYLKGSFPHLIHITNHNIEALACVSYMEPNKLFITNVAVNNYECFTEIMEKLLVFLEDNYQYIEIVIEFYYTLKEEKFEQNKDLERILTKVLKFRWVNMINDGKFRKIRYRLKNQKNCKENPTLKIRDAIYLELKNMQLNSSKSIINQSNMSINLDRSQGIRNLKTLEKDEDKINFFPLYSLFCEMMYNGNYNVESQSMECMNMEVMKEISKEIIENYIKTNEGVFNTVLQENEFSQENKGSKEEMKVKDVKEQNKESEIYFYCGSLMKLGVYFKHFSTTKIGGVLYNKISYFGEESIQILMNEKEKEVFYLLPTVNEKISVIISGKNDSQNSRINEFLEGKNSEEVTLNQYFNQIYERLVIVQDVRKRNIFLRPFNIKEDLSFSSPKLLNEFTVDAQDMNSYNINKFDQHASCSLLADPIKDDHLISYEINDKNDVVIRGSFVVAVIHYTALNELEIPSVATFIIKEKN